VTVTPGVEINGRIAPGDVAALPPALRVSLVRAPDILGLPAQPPAAGNRGSPGQANGTVGPDGSFRLTGVGVGDYRLNITGLPKGVYVQSAQIGQENVLATGIHVDASVAGPVEVRLAADLGGLEGTVMNDRREAAPNATVVLVPEGLLRSQRNLFKSVSTDLQGRFAIEDVPPGTYKLFAWDQVAEGAWANEAFMKTVEARGKAVTVMAKSITTVDGVVIPSSAVLDEDGRPIAYVQVEGERFEKRGLTLGGTSGDQTLVRSGIKDGERVVTGAAYQVRLASLSTSVPAHGHEH